MEKYSGKTLPHTPDCVKCTDFIHGKPHYKVQNMLRNLFSSLFDFNSRKDLKDEHVEEKVVAAPVKKNSVSTPTISKYDADIESLKTTYGELKPGMAIEITLQDLLTICPRNRKRIEAYNGLVSELKKRGVTLNIKSRKTK